MEKKQWRMLLRGLRILKHHISLHCSGITFGRDLVVWHRFSLCTFRTLTRYLVARQWKSAKVSVGELKSICLYRDLLRTTTRHPWRFRSTDWGFSVDRSGDFGGPTAALRSTDFADSVDRLCRRPRATPPTATEHFRWYR